VKTKPPVLHHFLGFVILYVLFSGCASPSREWHQDRTWDGEGYQVGLLSGKYPIRIAYPQDPKRPPTLPPSAYLLDSNHWCYEQKAISFEFGKMLEHKPAKSRRDFLPGQIGEADSMIVLIDKEHHPIPPERYRNRRLRVTGRLLFASPINPADNQELYPKTFDGQVFTVTTWVIETSPDEVQDLGPAPEGNRSFFPIPISDAE
jgi:hypothetical protein